MRQEVHNIDINHKEIIVASDQDALATLEISLSNLANCSHEEAYTRINLYAADGARMGHSRILIRSVDPDVVLAVAAFK